MPEMLQRINEKTVKFSERKIKSFLTVHTVCAFAAQTV